MPKGHEDSGMESLRARVRHRWHASHGYPLKGGSGNQKLANRNTAWISASFLFYTLALETRWLICDKTTLLCRNLTTACLFLKKLAAWVASCSTVCLNPRWLGQKCDFYLPEPAARVGMVGTHCGGGLRCRWKGTIRMTVREVCQNAETAALE